MRSAGGTSNDDFVFDMAVDGSNNLYLAGYYSGTVQWGNGISLSSVVHPTMGASIDVFAAKYDPSGTCQWARTGGSIGTDRAYGIDCDAAGNTYITGFYQNNATFSGAALTANGPVELFVAGYSPAGNLQLLFKAGSPGYEAGYGIALDGNGCFYITGLHNDYTVFDTITVQPNGSYDMFLAKYSTGGDVQWVRSTLSTQWEQGWSVAVDEQGSPYVAALCYHGGTSMFSEVYMTSAGYYDPVIVKYNRHGEFQWAVRGGTNDYDEATGLALADSGKVYASGYFGGTSAGATAQFGSFSFQSNGLRDIFLLKLRTDIATGNPVSTTFCAGQAIAVPFKTHITMAVGNVYTAQLSDASGRFANAIDIGSLNSSAATGTVNALIPVNIPEGSGYRVRVVASDSSRTGSDNGTDITIHPLPDATLTYPGTDFCQGDSLPLTAPAGPGYSYQWLEAFVPIAGAGGQVYYATSTGVYNVIVSTAFGCNRTSGSVSVTKHGKPNATISANGPTVFCKGDSVSLGANTSVNFTYQWTRNNVDIAGAVQPDYTVKKSGTYKCRITNLYGCQRVSSGIKVTVYTLPKAKVTALGPTTFCAGDSVVLEAYSGNGYSFQWRRNGVDIPGATAQHYTATIPGAYKVAVTKTNGCSKVSTSKKVTVNCRTLNTVAPSPVILISPNPVQDILTITVADAVRPASLSIRNLLGEVCLRMQCPVQQAGESFFVNVGGLSPGVYVVSLESGRDVLTRARMVKD